MAGSDGQTRAILVEDDPPPQAMFRHVLEGEGYLVVSAGDGLAAVRCAHTARPALVLLDLDLPVLDERGVATELRAAYGDGLPIVIMTATGQRAEGPGMPVCAYLQKPFDVDGLLRVVRGARW